MKQNRNRAYLLGQLSAVCLLSGFAAAVAAVAHRAWKRHPEEALHSEEWDGVPEECQAPDWRTLRGQIVERREGELLVDDGNLAIRFTTVNVPVLDARTGQTVCGLPDEGTVAVIYDANAPMSMSLPPLSNGAASILLHPVPADMVPLRISAEARGYQLSWLGFQTPIVLAKDDITLELQLDSSRFCYRHQTRDIHPLDRLECLSQPVRLDGNVVVVPADLIAMLV